MRSWEKAIRRFEKLNPGYTAIRDEIESYKGYEVVYIDGPENFLSGRYVFNSLKDFREWSEGVVFD